MSGKQIPYSEISEKAQETPVLFLIFNRLDTAVKTFEAIRKHRPQNLYIAADGPRETVEGEKAKCEIVRSSILDMIDWDCHVKTLFREKNLGCGKAVSEAITWFFSQVEEGIVLEDDCCPHPHFFGYCSFLLDRYRHDKKISMIGGSTFIPNDERLNTYYISKYMNIWGWATWKRVWELYMFDIQNLNTDKLIRIIDKRYPHFNERMYHKDILSQSINKCIDTWDYQFVLNIIYNEGYGIMPSVNLIDNIGFGSDATHTITKDQENKMSVDNIFPLTINEIEEPLNSRDTMHFKKILSGGYTMNLVYLKRFLLKTIINKERLFTNK